MRQITYVLTATVLVGCVSAPLDWVALNGAELTQSDVIGIEGQCEADQNTQIENSNLGEFDACMLSYGLIRQDAIYDAAPYLVKAAAVRLSRNLPAMVDEDTRLDSVTHEGRTLRLNHTIVDDVADNINISYFLQVVPPLVANNACRARSTVLLFENDVVFRYSYFDALGAKITQFDVKHSDCHDNTSASAP
ncbi:hypothetical protein L4D06_15685 [Enterovibrio makurazakiensis]|uniref:Lipoprotein n=1 Tax=Enterovibrio gelatinilyticus TaxID=2899819 RepID=A0ABT5R3Q4_9GAMM|nr:hypothetical protein [Enterovibrio sp. ZSDZ42]MDD1794515.1 hypothetical protein [Enterovibrio sp. ZSDZ42]